MSIRFTVTAARHVDARRRAPATIFVHENNVAAHEPETFYATAPEFCCGRDRGTAEAAARALLIGEGFTGFTLTRIAA